MSISPGPLAPEPTPTPQPTPFSTPAHAPAPAPSGGTGKKIPVLFGFVIALVAAKVISSTS